MMLIDLLVDPYTKEKLTIIPFTKDETGAMVINGVLINPKNNCLYPIINKVPVLIKNQVPENFYRTYQSKIDSFLKKDVSIKTQLTDQFDDFSFSHEWQQFQKDNMDKTWGFTAEERLVQFYEETQTPSDKLKDKIILDAGCGNGLLTKAISQKGAFAIGIDFSDSVFHIAEHNNNPGLLFVKGDLTAPPFVPESFDIIISNGVIHHTKSTEETFNKVAALVKKGGKFYVWLYKRPDGLYMNTFIYTTDFLRFIVNKLPTFLQKAIVNLYAGFFYYLKKIKRKNIMEFDQLRIDAYDTLTPKYKHYHHPIEVAEWFHNNGFESTWLSHWDNPYGFGVMSIKNYKAQTPGINFKLQK